MNKIFVLALAILSIFSCKEEEKIWMSDLQVEEHGRLSFMETPKILIKNCGESSSIELMLRRKNKEAGHYKVVAYLDGKKIESLENHFNENIPQTQSPSYKKVAIDLPKYSDKDTSVLSVDYFLNGDLVGSQSEKVIYLDEGEEIAYVDYNHKFGVRCGGNTYFSNRNLYPIPGAGDYEIDLETIINTYRTEDDLLAMAVSYAPNELRDIKSSNTIPIPSIPADTFYFPKEFKKKEGIIKRQPFWYKGYKEKDVGKYLTYGIRKTSAGYFKKVVAKECELAITQEYCIYEPDLMSLSIKHYPDSISNNYITLR